MRDSKIVELLKTFSLEEWRSCTKYLDWQFNGKGKAWVLFKYLKSCKNDWLLKKLHIDKVQQKITPRLSRKVLMNYRQQLKAELENFLLFESQRKKNRKLDQQLILGELYKQRGLYRLYKDLQTKIEEEASHLANYDLFTDLKLMIWHHLRYFSETISKNQRIESLKKAHFYSERFHQNIALFYEIEATNLHLLFNQKVFSEKDIKTDQLNGLLKKTGKACF